MAEGSSISDLLNSLDATTYFFVSSGIFIAITAVVYFGLGMWLGQILWGRFKRRFRQSEDLIEAYKGEVALLKRRIAEQATRPAQGAGPSPLQAIAFKALAPASGTPMAKEVTPVQISARALVSLPPGKPFTIWTEAGWHPPKTRHKKMPPGRGFTVWTEASGKTGRLHSHSAGVGTGPLAPPTSLLFAPSEILMIPRSRAFCLWTEDTWILPTVKAAPLPLATGFSLWTLPDFQPSGRGPRFPSRAHTLWTLPDWVAPRQTWPPIRAARAFTLWTEPEGPSFMMLPRSSAFTLWTEPGWNPELSKPKPLPESMAWSLWTAPDFEPSRYGRLPASRAFSIWTEPDWTPVPVKPLPVFRAQPFSIWAEPPDPASVDSPSETPPLPTLTVTKGQGFMLRAFSAARKALGIDEPISPEPSTAGEDDSIDSPSPPSTITTPVPVAETISTASALDSPLPPSRAFTLWTVASTAPHAPASKVAQSSAIAALIESKTSGQPAPTSSASSAPVPPVPMVGAPEMGGTTPDQSHGVLRQQQLNLEPLVVPDARAERSN